MLSLLGNQKPKANQAGGPLIQEISSVAPIPSPAAPEEGPTLMELMMAAQAEAKREAQQVAKAEEVKATKSFGSGFKKGFLGGGSGTGKTAQAAAKSSSAVTSKGAEKQGDIPIIRKTTQETSAFSSDVQKAMEENKSPVLKKLEQGGKYK